jgi:hypothetical protein
MVEQQPGIFREVSNDVDAIEEYSAVCRPRGRFPWRWRCPQPRWALTYIQIWTLASTFLIIIVVAVVASLWARLPFPHFHTLIYYADTAQTVQLLSTNATSRTHDTPHKAPRMWTHSPVR